ncbi:MAG: hypothetical protein ACUVRA_07440 [Candidatus Bathyarchaeaceae archaeon]
MGEGKNNKTSVEIQEYRHKEVTYGIAGMFGILMAFVFIILATQLESYRRWGEVSTIWYVLTAWLFVIGFICLCLAAYYSKKKDELLQSVKSQG